jgi:hypothetical protein
MSILARPYHLLLISAIILALCSLYFWNEQINIPSNEVFIEYPAVFPFWMLSAFLTFLWVLYHITFDQLANQWLTWLHVIITLICGILLAKTATAIYLGIAAQGIYLFNLLKGIIDGKGRG